MRIRVISLALVVVLFGLDIYKITDGLYSNLIMIMKAITAIRNFSEHTLKVLLE
jgi:hypothetical protein